ncbi:hypothetical protein ElyMa_004117600 [Elysia marginata]|uniref:Uncharacterized protein n=1 Tax=Elysia marginata TaxID=1093978 RepID=A0AAV4GCE8_9GAST|nr:hypothetical protein ElyMa_004117600 [Elysia marginata]
MESTFRLPPQAVLQLLVLTGCCFFFLKKRKNEKLKPGAAGGTAQSAQPRGAVEGQGSLSSVGSSCSPTTLGSGEISDASSARHDADSSTTTCTAGTSVTHRSRSATGSSPPRDTRHE